VSSFHEITHGYELDDGRDVIVFDEELEAIEPRLTRTIEIEQFVALAEVDPIYFDHPYFLVPSAADDGARRAYQLLREVRSSGERAALGRFVMRAKEYLAIVRVRDGCSR
jgi:DNA end-binding protein Ku